MKGGGSSGNSKTFSQVVFAILKLIKKKNFRHTGPLSVQLTNLLKTSNACRGEGGILHLGVADCVGQYPVVRTLTVRSTPPSDT